MEIECITDDRCGTAKVKALKICGAVARGQSNFDHGKEEAVIYLVAL